jgi:hypothetical protein
LANAVRRNAQLSASARNRGTPVMRENPPGWLNREGPNGAIAVNERKALVFII